MTQRGSGDSLSRGARDSPSSIGVALALPGSARRDCLKATTYTLYTSALRFPRLEYYVMLQQGCALLTGIGPMPVVPATVIVRIFRLVPRGPERVGIISSTLVSRALLLRRS